MDDPGRETTLSRTIDIASIERPRSALLTYYFVSSFVLGPLFLVLLIPRLLRYQTLRYRFDQEGVSMSWGVLFRREIHLTYARIQDIHLTSNFVERWLSLARIQIQTASASAKAEMTIEGVDVPSEVRDYLYERMRGARGSSGASQPVTSAPEPGQEPDADLAATLRQVAEELRRIRLRLDQRAERGELLRHVDDPTDPG